MTALIVCLLLLCLALLAAEDRRAKRDREKLAHVVYVNGIRGKSTTTRLIEAGLREGGYKVFSKTTGTLPMTIGVDGVERPLKRPGRANIREQLDILHRAAEEGAEVLVIECMAVDPVLQNVSQHRMVRADVGVITNVRLDHTEEMGETLEEICDALSNTVPRSGCLFTADERFFPRLEEKARKMDSLACLVRPTGEEPAVDFPENLALAAEVCRHLGVDKKIAFAGMARYQETGYAGRGR